MLTVGIVLLLIVAAITVITYNQEIKFAKESVELQSMSDSFLSFSSKPPPKPMTDIKNNSASKHIARAYTITAFIDKSGEVVTLHNYLGGYTSEEFSQLITKLMNLEEKQGKAYGVIYGKRKITEPNLLEQFEYQVVIAPLSAIYRDTHGIFFIGLSVVLGAMLIFYFISKILADVAVKPTEEVWNKQKRFIQDASHDLKTPLTVIMANNEILLSHSESKIYEQKKWLESTKLEGEHMRQLIDQMLDLAKSEALLSSITFEDVNISELTEMVSLQLEPIAYENNVLINTEIQNDIVVKSNKNEFTRLLYILIDNGIKYASSDTGVTVSLEKNKKHTVLCVNNKGNTIPSEDLPYIFDRFYRTDNARTKGGFGLGLSIAKNIVTALNGEISVSSTETDGTTFTVKIK